MRRPGAYMLVCLCAGVLIHVCVGVRSQVILSMMQLSLRSTTKGHIQLRVQLKQLVKGYATFLFAVEDTCPGVSEELIHSFTGQEEFLHQLSGSSYATPFFSSGHACVQRETTQKPNSTSL